MRIGVTVQQHPRIELQRNAGRLAADGTVYELLLLILLAVPQQLKARRCQTPLHWSEWDASQNTLLVVLCEGRFQDFILQRQHRHRKCDKYGVSHRSTQCHTMSLLSGMNKIFRATASPINTATYRHATELRLLLHFQVLLLGEHQ